MEHIQDKLQLLINPDAKLAKKLIDEIIHDKGAFLLDDSIKEELVYNPSSSITKSFAFRGVYPNHFTKEEDVSDFKEALEALVIKTNNTPCHVKVKNIDDLIFITFLYFSYTGEVYGSTLKDKYLDELADVYVRLSNRMLSPTENDHVWMEDSFTGNERTVPKSTLNEEQLMLNGGYKVYSRMIGDRNRIVNVPNDGKIVIQPVHQGDQSIELPERLSKYLTKVLIDYIIKEHSKADSTFYNHISKEDKQLSEWSERKRPRFYERDNRKLKMLILKLDTYIKDSNRGSLRSQRHIFIYNLLALLKLMPLPRGRRLEKLPTTYKELIQFHKLTPTEKSSAIRTILKDN